MTQEEDKSLVLPDVLDQFVYVRRFTPFNLKSMKLESEERVTRFRNLQRVLGIIEGTIIEYKEESKHGKIDLAGHIFSFEDQSREGLKDCIGKQTRFSFWPTTEEISDNTTLSQIKISHVWMKDSPKTGYVEAIGKLEKILPKGAIVSVWSVLNKYFYVSFSGEYKTPEHLGKLVWVVGQFHPTQGDIELKTSEIVEIVTGEMAQKVIEEEKKSKRSGFQKKKHQEPVKPMTLEEMWKTEIRKEDRMPVNAKLKIVLRQLPSEIKTVDKLVWLPLQNSPSNVPGSVDLSETPLDLFIPKKMWNNALKKVENLSKEEGEVPPIYVIEGLIGQKEGKLVTVATSVVVTAGKKKGGDPLSEEQA